MTYCKTPLSSKYLILQGIIVVGALLLALLLGLYAIQVLHVRVEHRADGDARQDAHHRREHQHQTHHHTLLQQNVKTARIGQVS